MRICSTAVKPGFVDEVVQAAPGRHPQYLRLLRPFSVVQAACSSCCSPTPLRLIEPEGPPPRLPDSNYGGPMIYGPVTTEHPLSLQTITELSMGPKNNLAKVTTGESRYKIVSNIIQKIKITFSPLIVNFAQIKATSYFIYGCVGRRANKDTGPFPWAAILQFVELFFILQRTAGNNLSNSQR